MGAVEPRVGMRQWKVLCAVDNAYPETALALIAGSAIGDSMPFSTHKPVLESLVQRGMLEDVCPLGQHPLSRHCWLRTTDVGAGARLNARFRHVPR